MPVSAALQPAEGGDSGGREGAGRLTRMSRALQAIVFDFDGVIADSEPLHLRAFQQALADDGIQLSPQEYFSRYLGFDDVGVFEAIARDRGVPMGDGQITALVARKGVCLQVMIQAGSVL